MEVIMRYLIAMAAIVVAFISPAFAGEENATACHKLAVQSAKDIMAQSILAKPVQFKEEPGRVTVLYAAGAAPRGRCPPEAKVVCTVKDGKVYAPVGPDFTGMYVAC